MITDIGQDSQLSTISNEVFKFNLKICQKNECKQECILNGKYCIKHRSKDLHKKCKFINCTKRPLYNIKDENKGLFCFEHKEDGMIDVLHKKCKFEGCNTRPTFNFEEETKGLFCFEHKEDGMINIKDKKCKFEGCNTRPNFNFEGETKGLLCLKHKEHNMIDVLHKKCKFEDCKKIPAFNFEGETKGLFCFKHKEDGMINVVSKKCKSTWCNTEVKNKYEGYCLFCFINLFPESTIIKNYKTKEKSVVDFIKENFKDYKWINDKRIENGCSKRRPDMLLDFGSHILIIEIDEDSHSNYDCSCENKRLMEISQDLGHRPIIFIRFNPDSYTNKDGKKIKSCWSTHKKTGILYINNKKQWKYRLNCLKDQIKYWIKYETKKTIETIELFYNE